MFEPLAREEVIKAVEHRNPQRVPLVQAHWWGEGFEDLHGAALNAFDRFPEDAVVSLIEPLPFDQMDLPWEIDQSGAHDSRVIIDDWAKLDDFIAHFPDPANDPQIEKAARQAEMARRQGRYMLFGWWRLFFERPWSIRGMTNLLMDLKLEPENIHRLNAALCDLYLAYMRASFDAVQPDGFWTSDDLGHQTRLFMRAETFRSLLRPYYEQIGIYLKARGVHWWLHSCGNNTDIMQDLAEAGVNVFHPVQKGAMHELSIASRFGDRMTFLAGIDVQHVLQEQDAAGVRAEVRFLIDAFDRPDGGMCIACGNGILPGTPLENIEAFLDEAVRYGAQHREAYNTTAG